MNLWINEINLNYLYEYEKYYRATPFFSLSSINSLFENGRVDWEERREEADGALMEFLWFAFFCLLAGRLWAARGHSAPQREDKQEEQTKWKDWRAKHTTNEWINEKNCWNERNEWKQLLNLWMNEVVCWAAGQQNCLWVG